MYNKIKETEVKADRGLICGTGRAYKDVLSYLYREGISLTEGKDVRGEGVWQRTRV